MKTLGPEPLSQVIGRNRESMLSPENTPGWVRRLAVWGHGRRLVLPEVRRERDLVAPGLRARINDVVTGRSGWPLLLHGGVGTGKTLAALCLCDAVGGGCVYATVGEMCEDLQASMKNELWDDHGERMNTHQYWHRLGEAPLTVLDEIGAREKVSDHHYDCLKRALDRREGKPCVYISNLDLDAIARIYDDRVASRLAQGTVVNLVGDDRRIAR